MTSANGHAPPAAPAMAPFAVPPAAQDDAGRGRTAPGWAGRCWTPVSARCAWLAAVPVALVNAVAFAGQLAFLRVRLPWPLPGQVLVAVTLESVAVYLAWQAHMALAADDSALRLRLAAYSFAAVIGAMNYSHYMAPHWRPTFAAVTFGLMSVSSPWLWSVHSRRASRDALKARGLIEPHAVRLGMTRWAWHPALSCRVTRRAAWAGETDPARAIALVRPPARLAPAAASDDIGGDTDGGGGDRQDATLSPPSPAWQAMPPGRDKAVAVLRDDPAMTNAEVAVLAGCDPRTVTRARKDIDRSTT